MKKASYENYCKARDRAGYTDYKVAKETGIGTATMSNWKNGKYVPKADKIQKIADVLDTSVDYILTGNETTEELYTCPDCGHEYMPTNIEDAKYHLDIHSNWEKAQKKFGKLYCSHAENTKIKYENANIRNDKNNSMEERYDAVIEILRCYFSDSVCRSHFNLHHVSFEEYVAMLMNGDKNREKIAGDLSEKIIQKYGTLPGIEDGKRYYEVSKKNTISITKRDKRDITNDLESLMKKLSSKEYGPAAYDGEELSEDSVSLFKDELELALRRLKLINKEKYNPNKNKK